MSEDECKAIVGDGDSPPNPLFTPPCDCPRCAPETLHDRTTGQQWLRIGGDRQRYRVEVLELGATGREVLG